jgi:hypothetical protein
MEVMMSFMSAIWSFSFALLKCSECALHYIPQLCLVTPVHSEGSATMEEVSEETG